MPSRTIPLARALAVLGAAATLATSCAATVARKPWLEVNRGDLTLLTPAAAEQARALAEDVAKFRVALAQLSGVSPPATPAPLEVVVFGSHSELQPFVPDPHIAGMERTTVANNVIVLQGTDDDARSVLYHELVHSFLRDSGARYPAWYEEGLAEFLGTARINGDRIMLGRPPPRWGLFAVKQLRAGTRQPAALGSHMRQKSVSSGDAVYALRWAMVDLLVLGHLATDPQPDRRDQLADLLRRLNAGEPEAEAMKAALGMTEEQLQEKAGQWVVDEQFPIVRLSIAGAPAAESTTRPAPLARVACVLGELSEAIDRTGQARSMYELASRETPGRGCGTAKLASLLTNSGASAEAAKLLKNATTGQAADAEVEASYGWYYLRPQLTAFNAREATDEGALEQAREHLQKAVSLDPSSVGAHWLLGGSYVPSTADARPGIAALELVVARGSPDPTVYYYLGALYARAGKADEARRYLATARRIARVPSLRNAATRDLDALGRGEPGWVFGRLSAK